MSENEEKGNHTNADHSHYDDLLRRNIVEAITIVKDLIEECEKRLSGSQARCRQDIRVEIEGVTESEDTDGTASTSTGSTPLHTNTTSTDSTVIHTNTKDNTKDKQKQSKQSELELKKEKPINNMKPSDINNSLEETNKAAEFVAEKPGLSDSNKSLLLHEVKQESNTDTDCKDAVISLTKNPLKLDTENVATPNKSDVKISNISCEINAAPNQLISTDTANVDLEAQDSNSFSQKTKVNLLQ